jgi:hypothetical protein
VPRRPLAHIAIDRIEQRRAENFSCARSNKHHTIDISQKPRCNAGFSHAFICLLVLRLRLPSASRWRFRRRNNRWHGKLAAVEKILRRLRLRPRLRSPERAKRANQCNRFAAPKASQHRRRPRERTSDTILRVNFGIA